MKNNIIITLFIVCLMSAYNATGQALTNNSDEQITLIPDTYFETSLIELGIDSDGILNGQVLTQDIASITEWDMPGEVQDFTGLEDFENLLSFTFYGPHLQSNLVDFSNNSLLEEITIMDNWDLNEINVSNCHNLKHLRLENNALIHLDVSNNTMLETLYVGNPSIDNPPFNVLSFLDLSHNPNLKDVNLAFCFPLAQLILQDHPALETLNVSTCNLQELNLAGAPALKELRLGDYIPIFLEDVSNPLLKELDVRNNTQLERVYLDSSAILNFDLSQNTALEAVVCHNGNLKTLNVNNGNNQSLGVWIYETPSLECIAVEDVAAANANEVPYSQWEIDNETFTYSENCIILGNEDLDNNSIVLHPNPVKDVLMIENSGQLSGTLKIYDTKGRLIKSGKLQSVEDAILNVSQFQSGMYFLKLETVEGAVVSKKVIKE